MPISLVLQMTWTLRFASWKRRAEARAQPENGQPSGLVGSSSIKPEDIKAPPNGLQRIYESIRTGAGASERAACELNHFFGQVEPGKRAKRGAAILNASLRAHLEPRHGRRFNASNRVAQAIVVRSSCIRHLMR